MALDNPANFTALLLFFGVLVLQFEKDWRVSGETTTSHVGVGGVTVPPSSLHHLLTGSSPSLPITGKPRPLPSAWPSSLAADSALNKYSLNDSTSSSASLAGVNFLNHLIKPSENSTHDSIAPQAAASAAAAAAAAAAASQAGEKTASQKHTKTHIHSAASSEQHPKLPNHLLSRNNVSNSFLQPVKNTRQSDTRSTSRSSKKQSVTFTDKQSSSVQKHKSDSSHLERGFLAGSHSDKGSMVPGSSRSANTKNTDIMDDPLSSFYNQTNITNTERLDSNTETLLPPSGKLHNMDTEYNQTTVAKTDKDSIVFSSQDSTGSSGNLTEQSEESVERTNSSMYNLSLSEHSEDTFIDALFSNSSSGEVLDNSQSDEEYDADDDDDYDDDYDDEDEDGDTDWYDNIGDHHHDYYEGEGLESTNRADDGNDDYEYETSDQAVEDMRPGGDNYYRGSKLSDDEWIHERSKVDINSIAASHPGQEVFVGPHTFEAEFGPISEVRSETMEMHQPFVPASSHDASLSILVFYTWIGIVTVMVIGAFIALKHGHRILKVVERFRAAGYFYQRRRTVAATRTVLATRFAMEEGQNLLTHQHV